MAINFAGKTINGAHGLAEKRSQELMRQTGSFWALRGKLEIIGGLTSREIFVDVLVYGNYLQARNLETELLAIEDKVGHNGTLELSGSSGIYETFSNCTFIQMERTSLGGRGDTGPIYDYAGTVDGGWCQMLRLHFEQLNVSAA